MQRGSLKLAEWRRWRGSAGDTCSPMLWVTIADTPMCGRAQKIDDLDALLRAERSTFLMVVGQEELRHARRGQGSPHSHWWWYLDELPAPPAPVPQHRERLAQSLTAARGGEAEPRAGRER